MAYLELRIVDNACINHPNGTLLTTFFINLLLIKAKLFPLSPKFASNILRFGEEPDDFTKMLPEPDNTILMSDLRMGGTTTKIFAREAQFCQRYCL